MSGVLAAHSTRSGEVPVPRVARSPFLGISSAGSSAPPTTGNGKAGDKRTLRSKGVGLHSKATASEGLGDSSSCFWMPLLPPRSPLPCLLLLCHKAPNVEAMPQTPSRTVFKSLPANFLTPWPSRHTSPTVYLEKQPIQSGSLRAMTSPEQLHLPRTINSLKQNPREHEWSPSQCLNTGKPSKATVEAYRMQILYFHSPSSSRGFPGKGWDGTSNVQFSTFCLRHSILMLAKAEDQGSEAMSSGCFGTPSSLSHKV